MENGSNQNVDVNVKKKKKIKIRKLFLIIPIVIILIIIIMFIIPINDKEISINVKSSLERIVEKSNLETITVTYNVIAKKCKKDNCDKTSNDIDNYEYVASCKTTITNGIDFSKVNIKVNEKKKKIVIEIPDAKIIDTPNLGSIKFLNGKDIPADKLPEARELCQNTALEKSKKDENLILEAKEQARIVLEEFYKQWIKAYNPEFQIEVI